jgi:predicted transcriptional regulator
MPLIIPDLAQMRNDRKITQAELAEMVGVSQPRISNLEKRGVAGLDLLVRVVAALESVEVETDAGTLAAESVPTVDPGPHGARDQLDELKKLAGRVEVGAPDDRETTDALLIALPKT